MAAIDTQLTAAEGDLRELEAQKKIQKEAVAAQKGWSQQPPDKVEGSADADFGQRRADLAGRMGRLIP